MWVFTSLDKTICRKCWNVINANWRAIIVINAHIMEKGFIIMPMNIYKLILWIGGMKIHPKMAMVVSIVYLINIQRNRTWDWYLRIDCYIYFDKVLKKKSNANCGRLIKNKIKGAIGKEAQMIWIWRIIFLYKNQNVKPITLVNFYTYIIDTYVYSF